MFAFTPTGLNVVTGDCQTFAVATDGTLYVLTYGRELDKYAAGGGAKVVQDVMVNSFSLNGNVLLVSDWFTQNLPDSHVSDLVRKALCNHQSLSTRWAVHSEQLT